MKIKWTQRRGQIKHQLYTLSLMNNMDKGILKEMFEALNEVEPVVCYKDCKWIDLCKDPEHYEYKGANGFCSKGERKDEVESDIDENWYSDEYRRIGEDEGDEVEE